MQHNEFLHVPLHVTVECKGEDGDRLLFFVGYRLRKARDARGARAVY